MKNQTAFEQWLKLDSKTRDELLSITDNKELEDRFYKDLEFGTGGLRGVMGAGTNRINRYTVKKVSAGVANYIKQKNNHPSIVIAYDTRRLSRELAHEAACVFTAAGIHVHLFKEVTPTPILSFAVRHLSATAGIVITASHNPKEYNGYKVYNSEGVQMVPSEAGEVISYIKNIGSFEDIHTITVNNSVDRNLLTIIGDEILKVFLEKVEEQSLFKGKLKIVYTPLHGSGCIPVKTILKNFDLSVVKDQELPDGDFPTVKFPNPEERSALQMAIQQAEKEKADIVIGTDPDCDRIGVAVRHDGNYELLTGNQIGALLIDFLVEHKTITARSVLIKTIVTNELGTTIAVKKGMQVLDTLTGFKYIGEKISLFEASKELDFVMGYEESFGFLVGSHTRDKDAVVSALLICEMSSFYKTKGQSLIDHLDDLYKEYGYYLDALQSFTFKGAEGALKIQNVMTNVRALGTTFIENTTQVLDYNLGIDDLPKENVIKIILECGSWIAIRPSGTEPKIKLYYSIKDKDKKCASQRLKDIQAEISNILELA